MKVYLLAAKIRKIINHPHIIHSNPVPMNSEQPFKHYMKNYAPQTWLELPSFESNMAAFTMCYQFKTIQFRTMPKCNHFQATKITPNMVELKR
jgi:hypothetical protein